MNEKGSTTFLGICLLMIFSYYGLTKLSSKIRKSKELQHKQRVLLCSKEINGLTSKYISMIKDSNTTLKYLTIGKVASLLIPFPGINLATKNGVRAAIKLTKATQSFKRFLYKTRLSKIYINRCKFNIKFSSTPFLKKRDHFNRLLIRKKTWVLKVTSGIFLITSKFKLETQRVRSSIKKVNLLQRFLLL